MNHTYTSLQDGIKLDTDDPLTTTVLEAVAPLREAVARAVEKMASVSSSSVPDTERPNRKRPYGG